MFDKMTQVIFLHPASRHPHTYISGHICLGRLTYIHIHMLLGVDCVFELVNYWVTLTLSILKSIRTLTSLIPRSTRSPSLCLVHCSPQRMTTI